MRSSSGRTSELAPNGPQASSVAGSRPVNPMRAEEHRTRRPAARRPADRCAAPPSELAPGGLGLARTGRAPGLDGPRAADPHERDAFRRVEPQRRLEVRLDGRGVERDRVERTARQRSRRRGRPRRRPPGRPARIAASRSPTRGPEPVRASRVAVTRSERSGNAQPSAGQRHLADPCLGHAGGPQERGAQAGVGVLEPRRVVRQQPARDDLVDRPEPGDRGQPCVDRRDGPAATASSR